MFRRWFFIAFFVIITVSGFSQVRKLDYFIHQGLESSPLLKELDNQVKSNTLDSLIVKAARQPQVNIIGLLSYAPVVNGFGYSEAITNGGNLVSTVNVSQQLFNKKTVEAQYSKIGLQKRSVVNTSRLTELDIKKTITAQYLTAFAVFSDISFEKILLSQARDEEKLLGSMVQSGLYKQTEYLSFILETDALEFHLNELEIQYQRELSELNLLCGISDTSTCGLVIPELTPTIPGKRDGYPFFQRFVIDSLQILNEHVLIDRNYQPRIAWFTDAGIVNNDPAVLYKNCGVNLGLSFSVPVFDGNQRKLGFEKLNSAELTRQNYRDFFRIQYNQQLRQLHASLKQTSELIPRLREHLALAESIVRQEKQLLNSGGISITDFVIALKNYITIKSSLNQYQIRVLQIINEINYWKE